MVDISARDKRMFELIEAGVPRRQIAAEIGLSPATMKRRINKLKNRINKLKNRTPANRQDGGNGENPYRDQRYISLIGRNFNCQQIAAEMGVRPITVIRRVHFIHGRGWIKDLPDWIPRLKSVDEASLSDLVKSGKSAAEIASLLGRSVPHTRRIIALLRDEGAFDDDVDDYPVPDADHDGFMEDLRAAHDEGAGEKHGIAGRGHFARVSAPSPHSGVGSSMALCGEN